MPGEVNVPYAHIFFIKSTITYVIRGKNCHSNISDCFHMYFLKTHYNFIS